MIEFNATSDETSMRSILQKYTKDMSMMLQNTVQTSLDLHSEMNSVYFNYVDYLVTDITTSLQAADRYYSDLHNTKMTRTDVAEVADNRTV